MDKLNLKPCPFCGGEAELIHDPLPGFFVSCKSCNAVVGSLKSDEAIEKWNRRVVEPVAQEKQPCAEWICVYGKDRHGSYHQYKCSNCGDKLDYPKKYCPGCGRRMRNDLD